MSEPEPLSTDEMAARRAAVANRWTRQEPMTRFEIDGAVMRDAIDDGDAMADYDRRGLLNVIAVLLDDLATTPPTAVEPEPQSFIPGYRIRYVELENAATFLKGQGWAGGIAFDEAVKALAASSGPAKEPLDAVDLDAAWLARLLHDDPALCRKHSPNGHPSWMRGPLCVSVAERLAARLRSEPIAKTGEGE